MLSIYITMNSNPEITMNNYQEVFLRNCKPMLNYLSSNSQKWFTIEEVAHDLDISRKDALLTLNNLVSEGEVRKTTAKATKGNNADVRKAQILCQIS